MASTTSPPGPGVALGSGEGEALPRGRHQAELALLQPGVGAAEGLEDPFRARPLAEEGGALGPVAGVGVGLGGDGRDPRLGEGDHRPHRQKLAGHRHAQVPGLGVLGHQGEGRHPHALILRAFPARGLVDP